MFRVYEVRMNSYHFSLGDSTSGLLGLCAEVVAQTREEASAKLRTALESALGPLGVLHVPSEDPLVRYLNIYVNPNFVGARQIDE
jgi:hypothetical protein